MALCSMSACIINNFSRLSINANNCSNNTMVEELVIETRGQGLMDITAQVSSVVNQAEISNGL